MCSNHGLTKEFSRLILGASSPFDFSMVEIKRIRFCCGTVPLTKAVLTMSAWANAIKQRDRHELVLQLVRPSTGMGDPA